jgi:L-threonylcarbamoyladenylate synthase
MEIVELKEHNQSDVHTLAEAVLRDGGLVIAPSDSVYGALVDATNEKAVEKLITFKKRPAGKPISVFVSDLSMLQHHGQITEHNEHILSRMLPGPFTVVVPSRKNLVSQLESEHNTIGLRYPDYPFITDLVALYGSPVTATSANLASRPPHYSSHSLLQSLSQRKKDMINLLIDAGELPRNKPSTVVDLSGEQIQTLRSGDIEFSSKDTFLTQSAEQTFKNGQFFARSILAKKAPLNPVYVILSGELGAGKTQFIKGVASFFGLCDVISPTYTVSYEYEIHDKTYFDTFIHADLYNIQAEEEIQHIGLINRKKGDIVCIEWGEKLGSLFSGIQKEGTIYYIDIRYESETTRTIEIKNVL